MAIPTCSGISVELRGMADTEGKQPSLSHLTSLKYGRVPEKQRKALQDLVRHHIESFNFMLEEGISYAIQDLPTFEMKDPENRRVSVFIEEATIGYPTVPETNVHSKSIKIHPSECRQRGATYKAKLSVSLQWMINGHPMGGATKIVGQVPIMVKSDRCRLAHLDAQELVKCHEEAEEFGGYFVINGNERIIRMLIMPRRNYPIAVVRQSWKKRGPLYTEYGISIRCVRKDQTSSNLTLHYLSDGSCMLQFSKNKQLFFVPVVYILKALIQTTDVHIYNELIKGNEDDTFLKGCVSAMLRSLLTNGLTTQKAVLRFVGERFRLRSELPDWTTDEDVTKHLLRELVLVHLNRNVDKFNMLIFMTRKLFALAGAKCAPESADSPSNQEVLLGGHLYLMSLKEKLEGYLRYIKAELEKNARLHPARFEGDLTALMNRIISYSPDVGQQMEYLLATGNLRSRTGLGLMQQSGFTVVAEKLNFYRYLSHFRAVHRGAFFSEMRTTSVRKLLPESWGFLCPVHTPDGAPCGLLNHLAAACQVTTTTPSVSHLPRLLTNLGMIPLGSPCPPDSTQLPVVLDGCVVGEIGAQEVQELAVKLRTLKTTGKEKVPSTLEIGLVPALKQGQFPGLYLFTSPARMMRPVMNLSTNTTELIGTLEQVYMDIAVIPEEAHDGHTTHMELSEGSMLSAIASLTPFSDFNQSPRNMYQCQMGKQTMGTPVQSFTYRMDGKLYRLQTPQSPVVRPAAYDIYGVDDYPLGTNAIVAVISYTGYDMEDAMILNKGSVERGLAHASVYKNELIDLTKKSSDRGRTTLQFGILQDDKLAAASLDSDGFPPVGTYLQEGDPFYSYVDRDSGSTKVVKYSNLEPAYVDQVKILGGETGDGHLQKAYIKLRICRNPIIGDKFASRAGQKGICSQKWPSENMPFTESGMVPDIIFNPHGFPSRMTIGMMIEMMAGKSASLHGLCHDCTPFTFSEENSAIDYFGKLLVKAGYNYYGNERMYSGIDGREFEADIFFGVVYYQRLRHMVSDKFQVRTTGPIDILTHQPVKGRKRAGGIRFGEMERDSLLAHGSSFLLQDRLLNCSDRSFSHICRKCGSIISPILNKAPPSDSALSHIKAEWHCQLCEDGGQIDVISVPYVFRYLIAELAAMNIRVDLGTT